MLEVADGRTLAQELRIGRHRDIGLGVGFADQPFDLVAGADRNRGFRDDHGEAA